MSAALTVRMDEAMLARLDEAVVRRGTTRDTLVRAAIEDHLAAIADDPAEFEPWQLALIDEGLAAADRGDFATPEEVDAVFAKHRR